MHQISCLLQLHNCTSFFFFFIWDSNQLINIEIISLRKWYYLMHDLFLRIILTEKSWQKCHYFSVLFYRHLAAPFSKRPVQRLWGYCAILSTCYCYKFLEVHLVGFSFLSTLLTVGCCSAKGPCTSQFHRPLLRYLQHLFLYWFLSIIGFLPSLLENQLCNSGFLLQFTFLFTSTAS